MTVHSSSSSNLNEYDILHLPPTASSADIRKAYLFQSKKENPQQGFAHQKEEEERKMMLSSAGRAILLAQKVQELVKATRGTDAIGLEAVSQDEMFLQASRLMEYRSKFEFDKKPHRTVKIGYHYTRKRNMETIRTKGLVHAGEDIAERISIKQNGTRYGQGIYMANNPFCFQKFGEVGLMCAILQGKTQVILGSGIINPDIVHADVDTVVGNKHPAQKICFEELVLKSSCQCIPLLKFSRGAISQTDIGSPANDLLWKMHEDVQKLIDKYINFNKNTPTYPVRIFPPAAPAPTGRAAPAPMPAPTGGFGVPFRSPSPAPAPFGGGFGGAKVFGKTKTGAAPAPAPSGGFGVPFRSPSPAPAPFSGGFGGAKVFGKTKTGAAPAPAPTGGFGVPFGLSRPSPAPFSVGFGGAKVFGKTKTGTASAPAPDPMGDFGVPFGLPSQHKDQDLNRGPSDPDSTPTSPPRFGITKTGDPCKRCIQQGCFCYQHKDQDPNRGPSAPDSTPTSPPRFGITKTGDPCKRCIQQGCFCYQHKDQDPKRGPSVPDSTPTSPTRFGVTKTGDPCKRCIQQGCFCYQHKDQDPNRGPSAPASTPTSRPQFGITKTGDPCKRCIQQGCFCYQHEDQDLNR